MEVFSPLPPLTPDQRLRVLAVRQWRPEERAVVARGVWGRVLIAVEPGAIALLFAAFSMLLWHDGDRYHRLFLIPIFAIGAVAFAIYAVAIMVRPFRALAETRRPIFIVDGYLRTRGRDDFSETGSNGYVAVLTADQRIACEWPAQGEGDLPMASRPAYIEFSEFGGIHAIDGRATGILPRNFPAFGIGGNRPPQ